MKQLTQKYCLVSLLESVEVGTVFSWRDWVLHVTFAGVHYTDWQKQEIIDEFEEFLLNYGSFEVDTLNEGVLGEGKETARVVFIDKNRSLMRLHNDIVGFLDKRNAKFNNPEWNREGFIPHSTIQKHAQVFENETIEINNIALIDMFPGGDGYKRRVVKVFKLKPESE